MKKALVAIALAALSSSALALVAGGPHDLSATGGSGYPGGTLSACQYCHAPHNANITITGAPLWNRNAAAGPFTMYTSNTLDGTVAASPNTNSMTCLSCHDGVSDMGATYTGSHGFGGTATPMIPANSPTEIIGTDLTDDHPVSIAYPAVGDFDTAANVLGAGLNLYGATQTVECGSCHDPHNDTNVPFLRVSATTICIECHTK